MVSRKDPDWQELAEKRLKHFLARARRVSVLKKKGPQVPRWQVTVRMVSAPVMKRLNARHRGKDYATDVLSFNPPEVFFAQGVLGDLVICTPVLKRQARELGHTPEQELDVLLVHGLLHLLGFDHEKSARASREMASREHELLGTRARSLGLIFRQS